MRHLVAHRDRYGGLLIALIGAGAILQASAYTVGTLLDMGPGFMPVALGGVLILCGLLIALGNPQVEEEHDSFVLECADWRGWLCILGGLLWFILVGERFGMFPGTFGCILIAAMGDHTTSWRAALALAFGVSAAGVLLFAYALRVQLPAFRW